MMECQFCGEPASSEFKSAAEGVPSIVCTVHLQLLRNRADAMLCEYQTTSIGEREPTEAELLERSGDQIDLLVAKIEDLQNELVFAHREIEALEKSDGKGWKGAFDNSEREKFALQAELDHLRQESLKGGKV